MKLYGSMKMKDDVLYIGEVSAVDLAKIYGTPLYVYDEKYLRDNLGRCCDISYAARGSLDLQFIVDDKVDDYLVKIAISEGIRICSDSKSMVSDGIDIGSLLEKKDEYEILNFVTSNVNMTKPLYINRNIFDNSIVEIHSNEQSGTNEKKPAVISVIDGESILIKSR